MRALHPMRCSLGRFHEKIWLAENSGCGWSIQRNPLSQGDCLQFARAISPEATNRDLFRTTTIAMQHDYSYN